MDEGEVVEVCEGGVGAEGVRDLGVGEVGVGGFGGGE